MPFHRAVRKPPITDPLKTTCTTTLMGQDPLIGTDVKQAFDEVLNARQALVVSP